MAYDRALIVRPDAMRVQLVLARCHAQLKSFQTARQSFLEMLAAHPQEKVAQNTYENPCIGIRIGRNTGQVGNHVLAFTANEPAPSTVLDKTGGMHAIRRRSSLFMLVRVLKIFFKQLQRLRLRAPLR